MRKKFNEITKNRSLDSLLGYVFISLLMITLLIGFPFLPNFLVAFGKALQTILGVLLVIGIVFAFVQAIVKITTEKKVKTD